MCSSYTKATSTIILGFIIMLFLPWNKPPKKFDADEQRAEEEEEKMLIGTIILGFVIMLILQLSKNKTNKTTIEVKLNAETKANLENLQGLTRSRNAMLANAKEVLPKKYMNEYDSFSLRSTLYQPEGNLDTLHSQCKDVLLLFRKKLTNITEAAGLDPDKVATWQGRDIMLTADLPYTSLTVAPLKSKARCIEKVETEYDGDFSRLIDIVRASIVVADEDQLICVAKALKNEKIIRLKNRFKEPLFTGYSDALYNVEIEGVICEVQLHVSAIVAHKEENHKYYEYFRSFFAGNFGACEARIHMLEKCVDPDADLQQMLVKMLASKDEKLLLDMRTLVTEMGDYYLKELLCRRLFELDSDSLKYRNMLACAVGGQGRYGEAEKLHRQCLEARKNALGEVHPDTLASINNLALAVYGQGRYEEAEELHRQCLEGRKNALGETHPYTLRTIHNLANAVREQGRHEEAEELRRQYLEAS